MDFSNYNLGSCTPTQIVNINTPINDVTKLKIFDDCDKQYDMTSLQYSYSVDMGCWSCYMSYEDLMNNLVDLNGDYYIKVKLNGPISKVTYDDEPIDYSTQLDSSFDFTNPVTSENTYDPYANLEGAVNLQNQLTDTISNMFGIPIYYFKLSPNAGSKDITFKEYSLMDVESVKYIKLIIADGTMPSSRPEFSDLDLDFQTDWETEISKTAFATAFGPKAQPMEGDLVYIPLMKRMWMVNGAYEEKNGSLMWMATTFKVMLVKYQEKGSVNLNDTEELVNSFVKNKYDDLFGDDDRSTYDSEVQNLSSPLSGSSKLYETYKSDALRKYVTCDTIQILKNNIYHRGILIADRKYEYVNNSLNSKVIYQNKYCGTSAAISFIITPQLINDFQGEIMKVGNCSIQIAQTLLNTKIFTNLYKDKQLELENGSTYLIIIRWNKEMNLYDISSYEYTWNKNIPQYKLNNSNYYFNINNPTQQFIDKYNDELVDEVGHDVYISNFVGSITNIKVYDIYNDNISEMLQMYPTHQHLMINDTAKELVGREGVIIR